MPPHTVAVGNFKPWEEEKRERNLSPLTFGILTWQKQLFGFIRLKFELEVNRHDNIMMK